MSKVIFTKIEEKVFLAFDLKAFMAGEILCLYPLNYESNTRELADKIGVEALQLYYCYYCSLVRFESALIKSGKIPGLNKLIEARSVLIEAGEFFNVGEYEIRARFSMFIENELSFPADVFAAMEIYKYLFEQNMKLDGTMKRGLKRYFSLDFLLYWTTDDLFKKFKKPFIPLVTAFLNEQNIETGSEQTIRQRIARLRKVHHWGHPKDVICWFQLAADGTLKKRVFDS